VLRACEFPLVMRDLIRREGDRLSPKQRRDVDATLASLAQTSVA
jgi:hypothetical protein